MRFIEDQTMITSLDSFSVINEAQNWLYMFVVSGAMGNVNYDCSRVIVSLYVTIMGKSSLIVKNCLLIIEMIHVRTALNCH